MLKKVTKEITQETIDKINEARKTCGFEPTETKAGDTFEYYVDIRSSPNPKTKSSCGVKE